MESPSKPLTVNFAIVCSCGKRVAFNLNNRHWEGTIRLTAAEKIIVSNASDLSKQQALAELFGPASWDINREELLK